jgi:ribosomal protein S18 acetylase RimI-like enzyme
MDVKIVQSTDYDLLVTLLHDADEDDGRIRSLLTDGQHTSYVAYHSDMVVGAVAMYWQMARAGECEIEYIATVRSLRRRGYGRRLMTALFAEARLHNVTSILVGTDNTAFDTIAFYQKCGFRMDHVRHDFFSYIHPLLVNNGLLVQDMLVLRCRL